MASVLVSPTGTSYVQEAVLGNGAFGTILKCKHGALDTHCVVKRVKLARQTPQERFASVQELAVLQQLRHRNLVRGIDGWIESKHTACLVMDYCGGGDLGSLLRSRKGEHLLEDDVCMIFVQLASVVAYLHANGIIHRDIKTSNILLDECGLLKLGDLGMCRHLAQPTERPKTTAGTLNYMSPEITREQCYSTPTDVWGLACVMFEVCSLRPAFHAFNTQTLVSKIRSGRAPLVPRQYSQPLRELLRSMLFQDETRRPTAADILESPCLQEARAKVRAMFGSCHGADGHGPTYSLAAVDPPLLSLMARFRSESGAELQLPEGALLQNDMQEAGASGVDYDAQPDTPATSTDGNTEAVVMSERGYRAASDAGESGAGRLHAGGRAGGNRRGCDLKESGAPGKWTPGKSAGACGPGGMMEHTAFGRSAARLSPRDAVGRGSTPPAVTGHALPGSATRMRAAARKVRM